MLADFVITIHDVDKPLGVRVVVHDSLRAMRSAVTQSDNRRRGSKNGGKNNTYLAICQRLPHMAKAEYYAIARFAPPHIGAGIVAHEMAHAAVWLWIIKMQWEAHALTDENDEWFAWILGELVRQTTLVFKRNGVYDLALSDPGG